MSMYRYVYGIRVTVTGRVAAAIQGHLNIWIHEKYFLTVMTSIVQQKRLVFVWNSYDKFRNVSWIAIMCLLLLVVTSRDSRQPVWPMTVDRTTQSRCCQIYDKTKTLANYMPLFSSWRHLYNQLHMKQADDLDRYILNKIPVSHMLDNRYEVRDMFHIYTCFTLPTSIYYRIQPTLSSFVFLK